MWPNGSCQWGTSERQLSAGDSSAIFENNVFEWSKSFFEIQKMSQEEEKLTFECGKRKQFLEKLKLRKTELLRKATCAKEQHLTNYVFLKFKDADQILKKGERNMNEVRLMDAERQRLAKKLAHLQQKKSELELRVHSHTMFHDFLEQLIKLSKFEEVRDQVDHLESLLYFRDQLFQRDNNDQDQISKLRTELLTLEDHSHLKTVHRRNQLSHLQSELERTRSEAFQWEQKWSHIEETAAKKTLLLGKIKMASLNLYETTGSPLDRGEKDVDVNDTDTQLDRVQQYIQEHNDIVRQYRSTKQQNNE